MLLLPALIALSTASTFTIPRGGSLDLPPGCVAHAVERAVDSLMGSISCEGKSTITFSDFPSRPSPCPLTVRVSLQSSSGAPLQACLIGPGGESGRGERMYVDLGVGVLMMEIKGPQDAMFLLKVASSLQVDRKQ